MADVKVSEELAKKFATEKDRDTPYQRWVRAEGLEIISGLISTFPHHLHGRA